MPEPHHFADSPESVGVDSGKFWADPASGISLGYCTNGFDRNPLRQARRGVAISSRAAVCALPD